MKVLAFPNIHICPRCEQRLATDGDGKPCVDCQWEREQFVRAAKRLNILPVEESYSQKQLFQAYTVFMCATALLVLSAIGWMLR